jgi:acetolactate synthase-1/2/3 large subunit
MFGFPGGGPNLDVIGSAAERGIRFVLAHGETEAAIMAATYGLVTETVSPVVVTRGPGAASVVNGSAQATLDRYPLLVVTDTVPAHQADRVAHQRLDQRAMLGPVTKGSVTISDRTTDEALDAGIALARRWPPGAVHFDYDPSAPEIAGAPLDAPAGALRVVDRRPPMPPGGDLERARRLVQGARRPVVIVGMEAAVLSRHHGELRELVAGLGWPVLTTYQAIGFVPTEGPVSAGLFTNGAIERPLLEDADLLVTLGLDLVEPIPNPWPYQADVVRISTVPQADDYLPATVDLVGDLPIVAATVLGPGHHGPDTGPWDSAPDAGATFRDEARRRLSRAPQAPPGGSDGVDPASAFGPLEVASTLVARAGEVRTVTVDAGAHFLAVMPFWPVDQPFELLISNGLATMGFAIPAAIGAALGREGVSSHQPPHRDSRQGVLALTGDGGAAMALAELETIGRLGLPVTVVVFNDSALSLIEIKQQPGHGGTDAVRFAPTDFAAIASGLGIDGVVVGSIAELEAALDNGWSAPRLIDARIDPAVYPHLIRVTRG